MYRSCREVEHFDLELGRGNALTVAVLHSLDIKNHGEKFCLVRSVFVAYAKVLEPVVRKRFLVLVFTSVS